MRVYIGQSRLQGSIADYARQLDLVELRAEPGTLPRPSRLRELRERAPDGFVWSIVLPREVAALGGGPAATPAEAYALRAAEAVGAQWLVLQTPASVTPAARARRRLGELVARISTGPVRVAWEPAGLWEDRAAEALAEDLGLSLVRDLARYDPAPGSVVYTRLRALGSADRLSAAAAERVALRLVACEDAFVVFDGQDAARGARALRRALTELALDDDDLDSMSDEEQQS